MNKWSVYMSLKMKKKFKLLFDFRTPKINYPEASNWSKAEIKSARKEAQSKIPNQPSKRYY
jgi:hypothetical protein